MSSSIGVNTRGVNWISSILTAPDSVLLYSGVTGATGAVLAGLGMIVSSGAGLTGATGAVGTGVLGAVAGTTGAGEILGFVGTEGWIAGLDLGLIGAAGSCFLSPLANLIIGLAFTRGGLVALVELGVALCQGRLLGMGLVPLF